MENISNLLEESPSELNSLLGEWHREACYGIGFIGLAIMVCALPGLYRDIESSDDPVGEDYENNDQGAK